MSYVGSAQDELDEEVFTKVSRDITACKSWCTRIEDQCLTACVQDWELEEFTRFGVAFGPMVWSLASDITFEWMPPGAAVSELRQG